MPESDDNTLAFYDAEAKSYSDAFIDQRDTKHLKQFMEELPKGGTVCDLGSGNGWAAVALRDAGFNVTAIDGSAGLAQEAKARHGLDVKVMRFEDFTFVDTFDGMWAAWSLHHARRAAFPDLLQRVGKSIRDGGILFLGMKGGDGEKRDSLDRLYAYYQIDELKTLVADRVGADILLADTHEGYGFDGTATPLHSLIARKTG